MVSRVYRIRVWGFYRAVYGFMGIKLGLNGFRVWGFKVLGLQGFRF